MQQASASLLDIIFDNRYKLLGQLINIVQRLYSMLRADLILIECFDILVSRIEMKPAYRLAIVVVE